MSPDTRTPATTEIAGEPGGAAYRSRRDAPAGSTGGSAGRFRFRRRPGPVVDSALGWVGFVLIWYILIWAGLVREHYLPPPHEVVRALVEGLLPGGNIQKHVWPSIRRSLVGFGLGIAIGVPLGVAVGWFKPFERVIDSVLQFFRQLSALALFPVFLLFFGLGEPSKYAIVTWAVVWPILLTTIAAVKDVEKLQIDAARSMGADQWFIFTKVVLPASVPRIFPGIRLGGAYAITVLVAAEMVGAPAGLGIFTLTMQQTFRIPQMYAGILLLGLLGLVMNYLLVLVERRLTGWQEGITNG
ncbi:ABC transporter permease [Nocardia testacea]|uniref:ABC transporter permease n=1 Tax=Nocardia testacea TaxID=248551 RepID=UPI0034010626